MYGGEIDPTRQTPSSSSVFPQNREARGYRGESLSKYEVVLITDGDRCTGQTFEILLGLNGEAEKCLTNESARITPP